MKNDICKECAEAISVDLIEGGVPYRRMGCSHTGKPIRRMKNCPMGYSMDEYNSLLEKCREYDLLMETSELQVTYA